MYNASYNTRGYRGNHRRRVESKIDRFARIRELVVVPCVQLLYEAAASLPSPDLFASARRSARLRFASFLRTRKHSRHVFSSPSNRPEVWHNPRRQYPRDENRFLRSAAFRSVRARGDDDDDDDDARFGSGTRGGARDDVARSPFHTRGVRSRAWSATRGF